MNKRTGRPKLPANKAHNIVLQLRISAEEQARIKKAARAAGQSVTDWHRSVLLSAAP
jgi:uncharacterized protein (DUF1778 family)